MGPYRVTMMLGMLCVSSGAAVLPAQVTTTLRGVVSDPENRPIPRAEAILLGTKFQATTGDSGRFRIDGIPVGKYQLFIRAVGFSPHRAPVALVESEPTQIEVYLNTAIPILPTLVVQVTRAGLFGVVGDTGYRPARGARVEVLNGGRITTTDSMGRFAFAGLKGGEYAVAVSSTGYAAKRFFVTVPNGQGKEVVVFLTPTPGYRESPLVVNAYMDLGSRLAFTSKRNRMGTQELARFHNAPLCDIAKIRSEAGANPAIIVNGTVVLRDYTLCAWRADEVELIEFGANACVDRSGTIGSLLGLECQVGRGPRSMRAYVVVWERQ